MHAKGGGPKKVASYTAYLAAGFVVSHRRASHPHRGVSARIESCTWQRVCPESRPSIAKAPSVCTRRKCIVMQSGLPKAAVLPPNALAVPNPPVALLFMPPKPPPPKPPPAGGGSWTAPTLPPPECRNLQAKARKRRRHAAGPGGCEAGAANEGGCGHRQLAANRHEYRLPSFQSLHGLCSLGSFFPLLPPLPRPPPRRW